MTAKIVGLDGSSLDGAARQTGADIIAVLEGALRSAREGKMAAVAIATIMEDGAAHTVQLCEGGFHTAMLGCVDIMMQRLRNRILDDSP